MDRTMKKVTLIRKLLMQFIVCVAILLIAATPLFYTLTRDYYAEDMIDVIESAQQGRPIPSIDLEEDIVEGLVIQFVIIAGVLSIAIILTLQIISKRLWQPFDKTLQALKSFKLENGTVPALPDSEIKEFAQMNTVLHKLMTDSLNSYRMQKEFTENASHELQTPLAVFQSKLDILLQQPNITKEQATIMQDLYQMSGRLSTLNRNLLLLAKMENGQFGTSEVDVVEVLDKLQPLFDSLLNGLTLLRDYRVASLRMKANRSLLESMVNNIFVNAVRHNKPGGTITLTLTSNSLAVTNTSDEEALDASRIFNRFYRPSEKIQGNGLGLAIVKAICEYHHWTIAYTFADGQHNFTVTFARA